MEPITPQRGIYIPPAKKSRWDDPRVRWSVIAVAGLVITSGFALAISLNFGGAGTAYVEVYITDAPAGFDKILLHVSRVEVGAERYRLPIVSESFDILDQQGPEDPLRLAAGEVPFARHTQIGISFAQARAHIGDAAYELQIEKGLLQVDAGVDIAASRAGALLVDLDMDQSVCVGPQGFVFCPKVKAVYFQDLSAKDPAGNPPAPQRDGFADRPIGEFKQETRRDDNQEGKPKNPFTCTSLCDGGSDSNGGRTTTTTTPAPGSLLGDGPFGGGLTGQECGLDPDAPPTAWDPRDLNDCPEDFLQRAWIYTDTFIVQLIPEEYWDDIDAARQVSPGQDVNDATTEAGDVVGDHVATPTVGPSDATSALGSYGITVPAGPTAPTVAVGANAPVVPSDVNGVSTDPDDHTSEAGDDANGMLEAQCALSDEGYEAVRAFLTDLGEYQVLGFLCTIEAVLITATGIDPPAFGQLLEDARVQYVEPLMPLTLSESFPDGNEYLNLDEGTLRAAKRDMQWYDLQGSGTTLRYTGAGVTVGVIDIGFDARHEALGYWAPNTPKMGDPAFVANWKLTKVPCQVVLTPTGAVAQWVDPDADPTGLDVIRYEYNSCAATAPSGVPNAGANVAFSEDNRGHGTSVAGVLAARVPAVPSPTNPDATGGVAPGASVVGLGIGYTAVSLQAGVSDQDVESLWGAPILAGDNRAGVVVDGWNVATGLDMTIRRLELGDNIRFFVASWSKPAAYYDPNGLVERLLSKITKPAAEGGWDRPIFFAAGNQGTTTTNGVVDHVNAYCKIPQENIVCVGAFETTANGRQDGKIATLSSRGVLMDPSTWHVDLVAQGIDVTTTVTPAGYDTFTGTSAANPVAAGCAALMLEANPSLDGRTVVRILRQTATRDFVPDMPFLPHVDASLPPLSGSAGHGLVNCQAAVDRALAGG